MNNILEERSKALSQCFIKFDKYDFNKELTEVMVKKGFKKIDDSYIDEAFKYGRLSQYYNPAFKKERSKIKLRLHPEEFFEIYNTAVSITGFCRGVNQYPAGIVLSKEKYMQFAIFCYYSSIYQIVTSFLALHGIIFIPDPWSDFETKKVKMEIGEDERIHEIYQTVPIKMGRPIRGFFRNDKWEFTFTKLKHTERWKYFSDLLKKYLDNNWWKQIPKDVERFWGYIKVLDEYKRDMFLKEKNYYTLDFENKKEFKRVLSNLYTEIPKLRHDAIYQDRKYSIMEYPYLERGIKPPRDLINSRIDFIRKLNEAMINWQYKNIKEVLDKTEEEVNDKNIFYQGLNAISEIPIISLVKMEIDIEHLRKIEESKDINKNIIEFIKFLCLII